MEWEGWREATTAVAPQPAELPVDVQDAIVHAVVTSGVLDDILAVRKVSRVWRTAADDAVVNASIDDFRLYMRAMRIGNTRAFPLRLVFRYGASRMGQFPERGSAYRCARCGGQKRQLLDWTCCRTKRKRWVRMLNAFVGPLCVAVVLAAIARFRASGGGHH